MKKFLCVGLTGILLLSAGCGIKKKDTKVANNETTLEIEAMDAGYGMTWLEKLETLFEAKNEGINVEIVPSRSFDMAESILKAGPKNNTADILIYQYPYYMSLVDETVDGLPVLADLTDVYETVVEGETKSIKDRIDKAIVDAYDYNNTQKYYAFPTLNDTNGMVYNADMFQKNGWSVPTTTDELLELADTIKGSGVLNAGGAAVKPFAWYPGYWEYCTSIWWAQYEGLENYKKFYAPDYDVKPSDAASGWNQKGRVESLRVVDSLIQSKKGYSIPGCLTKSHTDLQSAFLKSEQAAMMPNGGWLINEMKESSYGEKFAMMKAPVISALGQKLGIDEQTLRSLIAYIDAGETGTAPTVTSSVGLTAEEVIDTVREARYLNSSSVAYTTAAFVPGYSNAIPLAKKFLAFMTTKEASKVIFENSGIMPLASEDVFALEETSLSLFNKSKLELMKSSNGRTLSMEYCNDPVFYMNGLRSYTHNDYVLPEKYIGAASASDYKDPATIVTADRDYVNASWSHYVRIAREVLGQ